MKTKDELNTLKEEVETLNKELSELYEEEHTQVSGGGEAGFPGCCGPSEDFVSICPFCRQQIFGTRLKIDAHIGACDRGVKYSFPK